MNSLSKLAIVVIILTISTAASAQKKQHQSISQPKKQSISSYRASAEENKITVGGRMGLTFSQFEASGVGAIDYSPNAGMMIGGEMNMWLSNDLGVAGQLLYVKKSATSIQRRGEMTLSASYLEIPVYAKYRLGSGNIRPYVFAGPAIGFNLSASGSAKTATEEASGDLEGWSSVDLGLNFGGGVSVKLNPSIELVFDLGYAVGLNSVGRDRHAYGYHSGLRIMSGVQVPLR